MKRQFILKQNIIITLDLKEEHTEKGRLLVVKLNCSGCHTLDGKTGILRKLAEDAGEIGSAPPILDGEGAKVQEKWLHQFLKEPAPIRAWVKYRMPTFGFTDEDLSKLNEYFDNLSNEEIAYGGIETPETTPEKLAAGKKLFESFQCVKCHKVDSASLAMGASFLAPDLTIAKKRLKPEWAVKWLQDPQALQQGTMMPGFFPDGQSPDPDTLGGDANKQMEAIRDHLFLYETASPRESSKDADTSKKAVAK